MADLPHGGHSANRRLPDQEHGSSFLGLKIEDKEVMETDEGAGQQAAAESMVRVAKQLAGCAAMTWPS